MPNLCHGYQNAKSNCHITHYYSRLTDGVQKLNEWPTFTKQGSGGTGTPKPCLLVGLSAWFSIPHAPPYFL